MQIRQTGISETINLVAEKEKEKKAMQEKIANVKIGSVMKGTVESLQNYGAFIRLEDGLSGLVHV